MRQCPRSHERQRSSLIAACPAEAVGLAWPRHGIRLEPQLSHVQGHACDDKWCIVCINQLRLTTCKGWSSIPCLTFSDWSGMCCVLSKILIWPCTWMQTGGHAAVVQSWDGIW